VDFDPSSNFTVYCDCGAKYQVSGSHLGDSIECNLCGRRVRVDKRQPTAFGRAATALEARSGPSEEETHIARAVRLAKEHHFFDALAAYREILMADPHLRDVFYGMGYCHFREGELTQAEAMLRLADRCGHPTAGTLLLKVQEAETLPH